MPLDGIKNNRYPGDRLHTVGDVQSRFDGHIPLPPVTRRAAYTLLILLIVHVVSNIDRTILGLLLESIKAEFHFSDTQLGFLSGFAFALFYATLGIPAAWLADRSNRRNFVAAACAFWSAMTVACGFAQSFVQLALVRVGVAVGEAGGGPASVSILS